MARYTKILKDKAMRQLTSSKKVQEEVFRRSQEKLKRHKEELINDFEQHPVTREIESGPSAHNMSGTIIGEGNLFSFIGFHDGSNPISPVLSLLRAGISLSRKPKITKGRNRVYYGYRVNMPMNSELESVSKMPWESGSWLFKIERGISGLGHYIYENFLKTSRSGTGIQVKAKYRQAATFKRVKYMSAILSTFKRRFRR
jgi:hypothetical protein